MALELLVLILGLTWLALGVFPAPSHKPILAIVFLILAVWLVRLLLITPGLR